MAKRAFAGERRPRPNSPNRIGTLLGEDWFLYKVLGYLIDDGLHECRRVCHQWNAVCETLPAKLRQVPVEHVPEVLAAFPNAVELSCSTRFPSEDLDVARQLAGLTSMTQLRRLDYFTDGTDDDLQLAHAETYSRLQSLGVHLGTELYESFRIALLSLTGLKKLDVTLTSDVEPSTWTPLTELEVLRELSLPGSLLTNGSNQIMFPSTALTKLIVSDSGEQCLSVLDDVVHYAGTVRSLNLRLVQFYLPVTLWAPLLRFGRLEALKLSLPWMQSQQSILQLTSNIESIVSLQDLTLEISGSGSNLEIGKNSFRSLTNLHSLRLMITPFSSFRNVSVCVSHLTRLTSLALAGVSINGSLDSLDKLVYLSLKSLPESYSDLNSTLMQMTKLRELQLLDNNICSPPNRVLTRLKNLRRLTLATEAEVDHRLCYSLASLSKLTSFIFWSMSKQTDVKDFQMQFVQLTQLQELRLRCRSNFDVLSCFGYGTFPRLRHLAIGSPDLADGEERALFNRFPCLRSFEAMR